MALYRMAGLFVEMDPQYERLKKYAEKYLYTGDEPPEDVIVIDKIEERIERMKEKYPFFSLEDCEYMVSGSLFSGKILQKNGFVLHSSAVAYDGYAYLFSADSGVGKSTHTGYWQECFGKDKTVIINDDKPAIREIDGAYYVSGTPFSGKFDISENISVPLKAVCFIHRAEKCEIKRLEPNQVLGLIFPQLFRPRNETNAELMLDVLDRFLKKVPVYSLGVTNSPDAARFAYEELNRDNGE